MNASMSQVSDQNILLKAQLSAAGASQVTINSNGHFEDHVKVEQLQHQLQALTSENSHQKTRIMFYESENARLLSEVEQMRASQNDSVLLRDENYQLTTKIEDMSKDQEDLLELLADQDLKLKNYRRQMRELGQQVEASDDEN